PSRSRRTKVRGQADFSVFDELRLPRGPEYCPISGRPSWPLTSGAARQPRASPLSYSMPAVRACNAYGRVGSAGAGQGRQPAARLRPNATVEPPSCMTTSVSARQPRGGGRDMQESSFSLSGAQFDDKRPSKSGIRNQTSRQAGASSGSLW
uniref:Movement protein n=1 Tax=Macrostomum lignano TaxID=282301 RepID=A0A1I8FLY6_9PLAT